jgi:hypothetical protein
MLLDQKLFQWQCASAKGRGIPFLFEMDEWILWWEKKLGKNWRNLRGKRAHQFCMARHGDEGVYEWDNVKCITVSQNRREARKGVKLSKEWRAAISRGLIRWRSGNPMSKATKKKLSIATKRWRNATR